MGELNGRRGFVPFNMVEEVPSAEQTPFSPVKRLSTDGPSDSPDRIAYSDSLNTTMSSPGMYQVFLQKNLLNCNEVQQFNFLPD